MITGNTGDTYYPTRISLSGVDSKIALLVEWEGGGTEWVAVENGGTFTFPRPGRIRKMAPIFYHEKPSILDGGVLRWQEGGPIVFESYEAIARRTETP